MNRGVSVFIVLFLISMMLLINIPLDVFSPAIADQGSYYPYQPSDEVIKNALDYLKSKQAIDGGISGFAVTCWVTMAVSAADEKPSSWGLLDYLKRNIDRIDAEKATGWERVTLAITACGENPRGFSGIDFVEKIQNFYDGTQIGNPANLYDDYFGILALISAGVAKDEFIIQNTKSYIISKQNPDGGWGDADSTAAAIMALMASGENGDSRVIKDALSFLKALQTNNGGFQSWGAANVASTAWAVLAIVAAGQDPTSDNWRINGFSPIDFLLNLQQRDGCFNWSMHQNLNPEWMTSYVIPALLGKPYPIKIYKSDDRGDRNNEKSHDKILRASINKTEPRKTRDENAGENDDSNNSNVDSNVYINEWRGNIRIEGQNSTIWEGKVCVSDSTITALNESSGETEEYYIPYPSVLGALDEASKQGGLSYSVVYYPSWDAFYVKTIAGESDWWHYWVDYTLPMIGAGHYELTEDNEEVLWGYLESWTAHALRIKTSKNTVKRYEEFTVTVYNESLSPVENAVVYIGSSEYLTDENGNVTLSLSAKGDYKIYAEKNGYVRSRKITVHVKKLVEIARPVDNAVYIWNKKTRTPYHGILILGPIDIEVKTIDDVEKVEFYINNKLEYTDTEQPFKWRLNQKSFFRKITIKVKAYMDSSLSKIQRLLTHIDSVSRKYATVQMFDALKTYLENLRASILGQKCFTDEKDVVVFNLFTSPHQWGG